MHKDERKFGKKTSKWKSTTINQNEKKNFDMTRKSKLWKMFKWQKKVKIKIKV